MRPDMIEYKSTHKALHTTAHPSEEQGSANEGEKASLSSIALTAEDIDAAFASFEAHQKRTTKDANFPPIDPRDNVSRTSDLGTLPRLDSIPTEADETWNKDALVRAMRDQLEALERQNSRLHQFLTNIKSTDAGDLESTR